MAPSCTKKWSTELKAGFRQRILNKEINSERTDKADIETTRKRFYPDRSYKTFHKNWNSTVAEYRVGKAQNLYNKGKTDDAMTMIYSYSYPDTHHFSPQVNEGTLEEESYHSPQDSNFDHEESDGLSIDFSEVMI